MVKQWTATTVVAWRVGADDLYHGGCEPMMAQPFKLGDGDIYDPAIVWRCCLECGQPLIRRSHIEAVRNYFFAEQQARTDE